MSKQQIQIYQITIGQKLNFLQILKCLNQKLKDRYLFDYNFLKS